ncbi:MAG TPA: flagellar biosynthesis protein FlhF [Candidatus Kapabacteria bacterium]|jgi:flagellar biosynthesis protein FlhF|nr:flagellar biosynthesis protein FlhF [Candidatus Kapabacteria bacterium]HOV93162.1 flagellar biosynthesis protein FlhF [Candidatus Kapabacteria bacterium]
MKIKKYISTSLKEGKDKVLQELGENAVILSSRSFKDPSTSQDLVEIVAAIDELIPQKKQDINTILERKKKLENHKEDFTQFASSVFNEIQTLREQIEEISEQLKFSHLQSYPKHLRDIYKRLLEAEISPEFALKILMNLEHLPDNYTEEDIRKEIKKIIVKNIQFGTEIEKSENQQVIMLIGPTGSGKTLTLVKLAVLAKIAITNNIAIISTDSYKISGADQLQTYSSIAGIPFFVAYDTNELKKIQSKLFNTDIIFIDTIGKRQSDFDNLEYISEIKRAAGVTTTYMTLPGNLTRKNFLDYLDKFRSLEPDGIILTKIDESISFGNVLESAVTYPINLSYFANGQQVPSDIKPATSDEFIDFLMKNLWNRND